MDEEKFLRVKATFKLVTKRFVIPSDSTFADLLAHIDSVFGTGIYRMKFKDEDDDLVTLGNEEEYTEALKSVPKTGMILRLHLVKTNIEVMDDINLSAEDNLITNTTQKQAVLVERSAKTNEQALSNPEILFSKGTADIHKKTTPHKIESASKLSEDLKFSNSEVTGRIPAFPPASEQCLDYHFISQKPGCRKICQLSNTDKNDRKTKHKRKYQYKRIKKLVSPGLSSCHGSSCSSSSLSSEESSSEDGSLHKEKATLNEMFHNFEKKICSKISKDVEEIIVVLKKDLASAVTNSVLQQLEGAVIQSIQTTAHPVVPATKNNGDNKSTDDNSTPRLRYHHQNVLCDNCENEIFGPRYKCGNCSDYDLCEKCEQFEGLHTPNHVFLKIHYPSVFAGRKTSSGKLRPLLRANIYEEREKEREKEDLLQRKFDSGSEINVKTMEKIEKLRIKMREAERIREVREARKEECKNTRKDMKLNRKEENKELIQAIQNINGQSESNVAEVHPPDSSFFSSSLVAMQQPPNMQDENLSAALSGLQIVENSKELFESNSTLDQEEQIRYFLQGDVLSNDVEAVCNKHELPSTDYDSDKSSSDLTVVNQSELYQDLLNTIKKPDLVNFDNDLQYSSMNEEFVIIPKCFDLNSPLETEHLGQRQHNVECISGICFKTGNAESLLDFAELSEITERSEGKLVDELPVDLVASVSTSLRSHPDIASFESDASILGGCIEEPTSSILPIMTPASLLLPTVPLVQLVPATALRTTPESPPEKSESDLILDCPPDPTMQFSLYEPSDVVVEQQTNNRQSINVVPTLSNSHQEVVALKRSVDKVLSPTNTDETKPGTLLELASFSQVDSITQSQIDREMQLKCKDDQFQKFQREQQEKIQMNARGPERVSPRTISEFNLPSQTFIRELDQQRKQECSAGEKPNDRGLLSDIAAAISSTAKNVLYSVGETFGNAVNPDKETATVEYKHGDISVNYPRPSPCVTPPTATSFIHTDPNRAMGSLFDMGFFDRSLNEELLRKHDKDISKVVAELLTINGNSWHQTRH